MTNSIIKFLSKNTVSSSTPLPLVHTTAAYKARKILEAGEMKPQPCDVFKGEDLTYFFYGRPSYKLHDTGEVAKYWTLPSVFILDYSSVKPKRVYPFDTGAFKGQRYPGFIGMMDMDEFEASGVMDAPPKLVGSFFVDTNRYFRLQPRDETDFLSRYSVDRLEEEIRALHSLAVTLNDKVDDRTFSIELQTDQTISLSGTKVLAVIFPEEYCESKAFMDLVASYGAEPLPYSSFPLRQEAYYSSIYSLVFEYYRSKGLTR